MIKAMQLLNLQLLNSRHKSVKVSFFKPGIRLFSAVYDDEGNIVKNKNEAFTEEEIQALERRNVETLHYTPNNDEEKGIFESSLLDMSEIELPSGKGLLIKD